jgi:hypothetical protein
MVRAGDARWWWAWWAATLLLSGCAPHLVRVSELAPQLRTERYRAALTAREARGAGVDAQVLLWARLPNTSRLPGAEGRLLLAAPDAFRLRVGSLFGTALDLGARGDTLAAYVPSRRKGMILDARRDSLGITAPGGLAYRALSATWRPPEAAWEHTAWRDTLLEVTWLEKEDSLAVAVGSDGLPVWATLTRPDGRVRVQYHAWDRSNGTAWPSWFDFEEQEGGFQLTCKISRFRFLARPEPARLAVPIPADAGRLTVASLRRALERLGGL